MKFTDAYSKWPSIRISRRTKEKKKQKKQKTGIEKPIQPAFVTGNTDNYMANRNRKCSSKKAWLSGSNEGPCCL